MYFMVGHLEVVHVAICFSPTKDHEAPYCLKEIFGGNLLLHWLG